MTQSDMMDLATRRDPGYGPEYHGAGSQVRCRKLTAGCLFSGMGGFAAGLVDAGFTIRWANDNDKSACAVFRHRFPNVTVLEDDVRRLSVQRHDLAPVGEGDGQGGTGGRGGVSRHKTVPVSGVRLLPIAGRPNLYRLSFWAEGAGAVRLELHEAGDSSTIPRRDVRTVSRKGDVEDSLGTVALAEDGRTELTITADEPIDGRAWRLSAVMAQAEGQV